MSTGNGARRSSNNSFETMCEGFNGYSWMSGSAHPRGARTIGNQWGRERFKMRYYLTILTTAILALFGTPVLAQTPLPNTVLWNMPTAITTPATAQTYEPRLYINGNAAPATALVGVACTDPPGPGAIACTAPLSASNRDAFATPGTYAVTLSIFRADVGESQQSSPFSWITAPAPGAPTGLRLE